jgi:cellulose synthase/poly-beta-1,6-N-acetylglucosamine synthase-like glycosyltransferase
MLNDWTHWLANLNPDRLGAVLFILLVLDLPRYALARALMCFWDCACSAWRWGSGRQRPEACGYCPPVCVLVPGHNEEETIEATLRSLWGTYPRLEIVVIDDGSTDDMFGVARRFARTHPGVLVLRRPERGGKASALNFGLRHTRAEVVISTDADSQVDSRSIWEIVQPLQDPGVGVVSGKVMARNPFHNLVTWLQAQEYLHIIFVGRLLSARLGILGVASGAFSAFRRVALEQVGGWDVGPNDDGDMTLRVRKCGYEAAFAAYADCFTDLPDTWKGLFKQRRRWYRGAVRLRARKHIDMAYFWGPNFRLGDFGVLLNSWLNTFCLYGFWAYAVYLAARVVNRELTDDFGWCLFTSLVCYAGLHLLMTLAVLFYSEDRARDGLICAILPLVPVYQLFQKVVRLVAVSEELFLRRSLEDNFYPARVRDATWHW